ncbi:hypothetical protein GL279_00705 [Paracoccus limosus]|jgi:hypothetical protein|uniref:Uncharacterized protein n=1 Tax=Paracoccus limosus TaxID=913252 RepID=A0A844H3K0_9RHOB|nr:hypothetical protein [Paracoccus limosus]MTH33117.1 hypothetical protein [Paracoccus limosus]
MTEDAEIPKELREKISARSQDSDQYFNLLVNHIADNVYEKVDKQNTRSRNRFAIIASSVTGLLFLGLSSGVSTLWKLIDESTEMTARSAATEEVPKRLAEVENQLREEVNTLIESHIQAGLKKVDDTGQESMDVMTIQIRTLMLDDAESFSNSDAKEINRLLLRFAEKNRFRNHEFFSNALTKVVNSYTSADRLDLVLEFEEKLREAMTSNVDTSIMMVDVLGRDLAAVPAGIIGNLSDSTERQEWLSKFEVYQIYADALKTTHRMPENPFLYDILISCANSGNDADIKYLVGKSIDFSDAQIEQLLVMAGFIGGLTGNRYERAKEDWKACFQRGLDHDTPKGALGLALAKFTEHPL